MYLALLSAGYRKSKTITPQDVWRAAQRLRYGVGVPGTFTGKLVRPRKQKKSDATDAEKSSQKKSKSQTEEATKTDTAVAAASE